jgi:eukaryotic-like serine/threonine-protein kinase
VWVCALAVDNLYKRTLLTGDCFEPFNRDAVTICANPTVVRPNSNEETVVGQRGSGGRRESPWFGRESHRLEDRAGRLIGFRRALSVGCGMWASFFAADVLAVRNLQGGTLIHFAIVRLAVMAVIVPVLLRTYRDPPPTERALGRYDTLVYCAAGVGIAIMSVEFRGLASPYVPGFSLVLLCRAVTAQDHWRRGVATSAIVAAPFFLVLIGSAPFSPLVATQLHDPAALTVLVVNTGYIVGTYVFLVVGGHVVWSLRRQVFEARSLGRYRLKRRLASGGMGDVWVAYHPGLKRDVAVKILKPEEQERSASALPRFEREVRATAELMHPNTVRVFDYGITEDGLRYYVMELLQGETLAQHVSNAGSLAPARALHIIGQAARALGEAHEHGIVHRDVKPENLFLTSMGGEHDFIKVIDFGIAKDQNADATVTGTGWVLGTPSYLSPEVAMGKAADPRSDVYALGAVLYFLLCGRPPFEDENVAALVFAHINERPVSPSRKLGRQLPTDVEAAVMRALEKDPDARFATALEFALALASCTLAGKWTFGDAALVARNSSRPPPPSGIMSLPSMRAPRVPDMSLSGSHAASQVDGRLTPARTS